MDIVYYASIEFLITSTANATHHYRAMIINASQSSRVGFCLTVTALLTIVCVFVISRQSQDIWEGAQGITGVKSSEREPGTVSRRAIVTIVTSPSFIPGTITLAYSVKKHDPSLDRICLLTTTWKDQGIKQEHIDILERAGYELRYFDPLYFPLSEGEKIYPKFQDMLLKLQSWSLYEYGTVAMIDADVLVNDSIQEPMTLLEASTLNFAATMSPALHIDPTFKDVMSGHFNTGVVFFKPNKDVHEELIRKCQDRSEYTVVDLADQSFLNNQYYGRYLGLPARYNLIIFPDRIDYFARFVAGYKDFAVLHFVGGNELKPWTNVVHENAEVEAGRQLWRNEYKAAKDAYSIAGDVLF